jgi:hypothetical protein
VVRSFEVHGSAKKSTTAIEQFSCATVTVCPSMAGIMKRIRLVHKTEYRYN